MRSVHLIVAVLVAAHATVGARTTFAQDVLPDYHRRASVNLVGIPFGVASGEFEQMTAPDVSLGLSAGYWAALGIIADQRYSWAEAKVRYYPSAGGPGGFAIGAAVGAARVEALENDGCLFLCTVTGNVATGPTFGVNVDYSWLLGRTRDFYIGAGVGGKRVFGLEDTAEDDYPQVLPSTRLQFGFAF